MDRSFVELETVNPPTVFVVITGMLVMTGALPEAPPAHSCDTVAIPMLAVPLTPRVPVVAREATVRGGREVIYISLHIKCGMLTC